VSADDAFSRREKAAIVRQIRTLMEYWAIAPEDLAQAPHPPPAPAGCVEAAPALKYRHPKTGEGWNGDGAHPQWLRDALLKEGYTVAELRAAASPSA
jgi:DNA-binding protein H-NS